MKLEMILVHKMTASNIWDFVPFGRDSEKGVEREVN